MADQATPQTGIEAHQALLDAKITQVNREMAVRSALAQLESRSDDPTQSYEDILRRLYAVLGRELGKEPSSSSEGAPGDVPQPTADATGL